MSGATVLGDGEIVLILNPVALAAPPPPGRTGRTRVVRSRRRGAAAAAPAHGDGGGRLADRAQDHRSPARARGAIACSPPRTAWTRSKQLIDLKPDVVLTDIEMPRMDGFDLVRNIRADARLHDLPVVVITSRLAEKHRRYALEVGADHYLGKPYQEEAARAGGALRTGGQG